MKTGLDRVTKEIDALTYNAKTITNALIRSTVAGGSSKGYSVTRVGTQITLDRVDIYRLYNFYREWEAVSYDINKFYPLIDQMDAVAVRDERGIEINTTATTTALVKHSKILFMNADNISNATADDYWLGKLQNANNPKLISNSSPIPLNLRTPIFDENMGTDKYNTLPTYLFPYAYFALDYQGYSGDGVDHMMGGNSWDIQGDIKVSLTSPEVSLGSVNTSSVTKTKARRNNEGTWIVPYTTTFGFDTHARAPYSIAGGLSSIVPGDGIDTGGSIAIGLKAIASGYKSTSLGGEFGSVPSIGGVSVGGANNTVSGTNGFNGGGTGNIVGAEIFDFIVTTSSSTETCVIDLKACIAKSGTSSTGNDVILIKGNVVTHIDIENTCILFDYTVTSNGTSGLKYHDVNGDAFSPQYPLVKSVRYDIATDYTIVTLDQDVKQYGFVDGGRVAMYSNANTNTVYGDSSATFGSGLIAKGSNQTVVGEYNYITIEDNFVVGSGTDTTQRYNSFESHKGGGNTLYGSKHHFYEFNNAWDLYDGDASVTGIDVNSTSVKIMSGKSKILANNSGEVFAGTFDQSDFKAIKGFHVLGNVVDVINRGAIGTNANRSVNIISGCTYDANGVIHSLQPVDFVDSSNALNILSSGNIGIKTEDKTIYVQSGHDIHLSAINGNDGTIYISADNIVFTGKSSAFAGNADGTSSGSASDTTLPSTLSTFTKNTSLFINDGKYASEIDIANYSVNRFISGATMPDINMGHLNSYTGKGQTGTLYTTQTFTNYDLTLGQNSNDPYQMIGVRTVTGHSSTDIASNWGYLAWYEDIRYIGKWHTVVFPFPFNHAYYSTANGTFTHDMNTTTDYDISVKYCIIGDSLSYIIDFKATGTGYGGTAFPPIDGACITFKMPCSNSNYTFESAIGSDISSLITVRDSNITVNKDIDASLINESFIAELSNGTSWINVGIKLSSNREVGSPSPIQKYIFDYLNNEDTSQTHITTSNPLVLQFTGIIPIKNVKNINGRPIG